MQKFEPFEELGYTKSQADSRGSGLAVAHKIILQHHDTIAISNHNDRQVSKLEQF